MNKIKYIFFLLIAVFGNPFNQMAAYFISLALGFSTSEETNVYQANIFVFLIVLVLIFSVRLAIYSFIYCSKEFPFSFKGNHSFLFIFSQRHLPQIAGILSFLVWISPLEGNIIGFAALPLTFFLGLTVTIITFLRIIKIKEILIEKISQN